MAQGSSIEWTDTTWNPVAGCTPVSPGCLHCYAATMAHRLDKMGQEKYRGLTVLRNGVRTFNGKINLAPDALEAPLSWRKPRRVFVNSMSDLFHEGVPFEFVDKVFATMALSPAHTFQILTKRPERMAEYLRDGREQVVRMRTILANADNPGSTPETAWPLPNVWLGTSVENQKAADERIPHLLRCPAAVRFLSCEPLLGAIDLKPVPRCTTCRRRLTRSGSSVESYYPCPEHDDHGQLAPDPTIGVDWVIVGGESGPGARPCNVEWIRSIVGQCKDAGVPAFVKQLGAKPYQSPRGDNTTGYELPINDKKGGNPDEWPSDLRVRQFPMPAVLV